MDLIEFSGLLGKSDANYSQEKPLNELARENKIRQELIEQGIPENIADTIIGYTPEQVPFIYRETPYKATYFSNKKQKWIAGKSCKWIGTTVPIWDLRNEDGITYQIPEIIVGWEGRVPDGPDQEIEDIQIKRYEIKHLENGGFVEITYTNVSEMGAFDGSISSIGVNLPMGTTKVYGAGPDIKTYREFQARRNTGKTKIEGSDHEWYFLDLANPRNSVEGTTHMLSGFELTTKINNIIPVKEDFNNARLIFPKLENKGNTILPASEEDGFWIIMRDDSKYTNIQVKDLMSDALEIMDELFPVVMQEMKKGEYIKDAVEMTLDGMLRLPEKLWVMGRRLSELDNKQRFTLASVVSKSLNDGSIHEWVKNLDTNLPELVISDIKRKNARNMVMSVRNSIRDDKEEFKKVKNVVQNKRKGQITPNTDRYTEFLSEQACRGIACAIVERYLEFLIQTYSGAYLA